MAHDVFISHSVKDKSVADAVCAALEGQGIRCWMAPRDILPGADWSGSIVDAIEASRVMVLIFSAKVNTSPAVRAEVELAFQRKITIIQVRIEDVMPRGALECFFTTPNWIDAVDRSFPEYAGQVMSVVANALESYDRHNADVEPRVSKPPKKRGPPRCHIQYDQANSGRPPVALNPEEMEVQARSARGAATQTTSPLTEATAEAIGDLGVAGIVGQLSIGSDGVFSSIFRAGAKYIKRKFESPIRTVASNQSDEITVSAFAPGMAALSSRFLVQVYLHRFDEETAVTRMALVTDSGASKRSSSVLALAIPVGETVTVELVAADLAIDEPVQTMKWTGQPNSCAFVVTMPSAATQALFPIRVRISRKSVPAGSICFTIKATSEEADTGPPVLRGDWARKYLRAFLSYAKEDRSEVLKSVQVLNSLEIGFFQDILSLNEGEEWEPRLYKEIEAADLFLLFWSTSAVRSKWVSKEIEHALSLHEQSDKHRPDIKPIILEGPPAPEPPDNLKHIHFNSMLRYMIAAAEAERHAAKT